MKRTDGILWWNGTSFRDFSDGGLRSGDTPVPEFALENRTTGVSSLLILTPGMILKEVPFGSVCKNIQFLSPSPADNEATKLDRRPCAPVEMLKVGGTPSGIDPHQ